MRQPPGFHNLVTALEILRVPSPPHPVPHPFMLFLTVRRSAALLAFAYPWIRLKKLAARHTPLPIKQFKLFHEKKFNRWIK
jgi:hypothetical protein